MATTYPQPTAVSNQPNAIVYPATSETATAVAPTQLQVPGAGIAQPISSVAVRTAREGEVMGRAEGRAEGIAEAMEGPAAGAQTASGIQQARTRAAGVRPKSYTSSCPTEHTIPTQATAGSYATAPGTTTTVIYPRSLNSNLSSHHRHHGHHSSLPYSPRPSYNRRWSRSVGATPAVYTIQAPAQVQPVQATIPMESYGTPTGRYPRTYGAGGMGHGYGNQTPVPATSSAYGSFQGYSSNYPYRTQAAMPTNSSTYSSYPRYSNNYPSGATGAGNALASSTGRFLDRVFGHWAHPHSAGTTGALPASYSQPQVYGPQVVEHPTTVVVPSSRRNRRRRRSY